MHHTKWYAHFLLPYPRRSLSSESHVVKDPNMISPFRCSIEAPNIDRLATSYKNDATSPIGINPRPASASRALLRLSPCHRAYRRPARGRISGTPDSLDLTGGEYKARERIHPGVADPGLLAIPTSWRRIAASNPNWGYFYKDLLHLAVLRPVVVSIVSRVQPKASRDMRTWRHPHLPLP